MVTHPHLRPHVELDKHLGDTYMRTGNRVYTPRTGMVL